MYEMNKIDITICLWSSVSIEVYWSEVDTVRSVDWYVWTICMWLVQVWKDEKLYHLGPMYDVMDIPNSGGVYVELVQIENGDVMMLSESSVQSYGIFCYMVSRRAYV